MNNKNLGYYGEMLATEYLEKEGYQILKRNFYSYSGEIDIIAKDQNEIVFCEVKTRRNFKYGKPVESVNKYKCEHIYKTAKYYLYKNNLNNIFVRFDIIEVYILNNKISVNHIKNIEIM